MEAETIDVRPKRKMEKQGETVSALVTQEIKTKYKTHYHDDKKQRKSDHVTEIHGR